MLVVLAACILATLWYLSTYEVASVFTQVNNMPYGTPYGAPYTTPGGVPYTTPGGVPYVNPTSAPCVNPNGVPDTSNSQPRGITAGPDGALWFTDDHGNRIGRITTSGQVREFPLPTAHSTPEGSRQGPMARSGSRKQTATRSGGSRPVASCTNSLCLPVRVGPRSRSRRDPMVRSGS